ncbi:DUF1963 domain-containing protein [Roseibium sp.]|uniref:DUF1963 domain-containing protein n=1 Tax=Roseibium sp. TaxID=1936156 RepID=UPI003B510EEA
MTSGVSWPCNDQGHPLHFLAQLDLSKVPRASASPYLPQYGHLAFFVDTEFDQPNKALRHEKFDEYC